MSCTGSPASSATIRTTGSSAVTNAGAMTQYWPGASARKYTTGVCSSNVCTAFPLLLTDNRDLAALDYDVELLRMSGIDRDKLAIWFNGIRLAHKGERDPDYDEAKVSAEMTKPEISLKVALGMGKGRDRVLTCDLTKEYVAINGDYRS